MDSWNRNSALGKARGHFSREVLICASHLDIRRTAGPSASPGGTGSTDKHSDRVTDDQAHANQALFGERLLSDSFTRDSVDVGALSARGSLAGPAAAALFVAFVFSVRWRNCICCGCRQSSTLAAGNRMFLLPLPRYEGELGVLIQIRLI
jgi:hypothetical protein